MDWIVSNIEWIFSGVGVMILGWFFSRSFLNKNKQIQKGGHGSTNIQAGKDIHMGHRGDDE